MTQEYDFPPGISERGRDLYRRMIAEEIGRHGCVRPPWQFMNADPYSIGWRMGAGEDHIIAFGTWWASVANDEPARIEWVRRWSPPGSWLPWAARLIWPDQERAEDVDIVRRLEALGIGSVAAWEDAEREDEAAFEAELASRPRSARE